MPNRLTKSVLHKADELGKSSCRLNSLPIRSVDLGNTGNAIPSPWEVRQMLKAKDIMKTDVLAVTADTDIYQAIRIMVENNITGLPVVDNDEALVGVVTEKDVLRLLYQIEDRPGRVADFMTQPVVAFDREDDIAAVANGLAAYHFRRVPVLSGSRLVGIISRKDIVKHIKRHWIAQNAPA